MSSDIETNDAETGRRLGHDLFRHRLQKYAAEWPASVREGYEQASAREVAAARPDRYIRKWLQLRLGALKRGRAFDERITPELLRQIDVAECPVTRVALTHGELVDSDWSIDRLNNDGAYAPNNLAVMSRRANLSKGRRSFDEVVALAGMPSATDGLTPVEWQRLAALMLGPSFAATPQRAPTLPELVPPTPHRLLLGAQQVQQLICANARTPAGKNALIKVLRDADPGERSRFKLQQLIEAVHVALKTVDRTQDVWMQPGVMAAFACWRETLDNPSWSIAAEISRRLSGARVVPKQRLQSWCLGTRGYAA